MLFFEIIEKTDIRNIKYIFSVGYILYTIYTNTVLLLHCLTIISESYACCLDIIYEISCFELIHATLTPVFKVYSNILRCK